jgi:hypothetical protein
LHGRGKCRLAQNTREKHTSKLERLGPITRTICSIARPHKPNTEQRLIHILCNASLAFQLLLPFLYHYLLF